MQIQAGLEDPPLSLFFIGSAVRTSAVQRIIPLHLRPEEMKNAVWLWGEEEVKKFLEASESWNQMTSASASSRKLLPALWRGELP